MIRVTQQYPVYGVNYGPGYTAFLSRKQDWEPGRDWFRRVENNVVSGGINWFSHWDEVSGVPVSHTFTIQNAAMTIEAFGNGVWRGNLDDYLHDPDIALLVRKHIKLTDDLAQRICRNGQLHIGEPYNYKLIKAHAAANTVTGHFLTRWTRGGFEQWLIKLADKPHTWICSKDVATDLREPDLIVPGSVLEWNPAMVKPVDLFEDVKIFEDGAIELVPPGHPLDNKS